MMMNSVTAAVPSRIAVKTLGVNTGLAMRSNMKDAPHRAESPRSWKKYLIFTVRAALRACQGRLRAARD